MKSLFAAAALLLAAAAAFLLPAVPAFLLAAEPALAADDCILDNCADKRPLPAPPSTPAQEPRSAPPADSSRDSSPGPRRDSSAPAGDFDFYVLALSWSPSFCASGGASRSPAQCAQGANPGFVVHGLWPQYNDGYPSHCEGNAFLPYSVQQNLRDLYPDLGLARHEWRQHGLCSGKSPSGYFADVRAARDAVAIPPDFKRPGEDKRLAPLEIQRAFLDANSRLRPGMMAVTCRRGMFLEARFCLSKDLRNFVACPQVAREGCFSQSIIVPAAR